METAQCKASCWIFSKDSTSTWFFVSLVFDTTSLRRLGFFHIILSKFLREIKDAKPHVGPLYFSELPKDFEEDAEGKCREVEVEAES